MNKERKVKFYHYISGITRTSIKGQSPTIYSDIISLIQQCVQHESSIVLHVIPSSVDFTTSESIRLCQKYDPKCMKIVFFKIEFLLIDSCR